MPHFERLGALALPTAAIVCLAVATPATAQFPWETDEVLLGSTDGSRTADDVVAAIGDLNTIYVTQTGSTSQQDILRFTLTRDPDQQITGATRDYDSNSTLDHNNAGLKALDVLDADTLYYSMEEGDDDTDGQIGRATSLAAVPVTHSLVADLTNVRTGGVPDFDPEGLAIDRANRFLYVMTDDGPNGDVAQYTINNDLSLTFNWVTTVESGTGNGNDGIVLPDGRVAVVAGSSSVNIYAVSQDGNTVTNLLGGSTGDGNTDRDTPQDLLVHDGFLYLAWESGIIDAFDLTALSTTPDDSIDLDSLIGNLSVGGIATTNDGDLLVSTRGAGGSEGEIYAFNLPPIPPTIGVAKAAATTVDNGDGTFDSSLTFTVENLGDAALEDVQVTDDLTTTFPAPATFSVISGPTASGTLTANGSFNGNGDTDLLDAASSTLAVGAVETITLTVRFDPNTLTGPFENQAEASAMDGGKEPEQTTDLSDNGAEPDANGNADPTDKGEDDPTPISYVEAAGLRVTKTMAVTGMGGSGSEVTIDIALENTGNVTLSDVSATDDLEAVFGSSPANWTLVSVAKAGGPSTFDVDPSFTGIAPNTELVLAASSLEPGEIGQVEIVLDVTAEGEFTNGVQAAALTPTAQSATSSDTAVTTVVADRSVLEIPTLSDGFMVLFAMLLATGGLFLRARSAG